MAVLMLLALAAAILDDATLHVAAGDPGPCHRTNGPGCCKTCVAMKPLVAEPFTVADMHTSPGKSLKVYIPSALRTSKRLTERCKSPHRYTEKGVKVHVPTDSVLYPVRDWLWRHDEYISYDMQRQFVMCGTTHVNTSAEADLCWQVSLIATIRTGHARPAPHACACCVHISWARSMSVRL